MSVYNIRIIFDDDWYVLQALEDESIFTQSRTLDEAVVMLRDVLVLMKDERDAEIRLIVPADLPVDDSRQSGRFTHAVSDDEDGETDLSEQNTDDQEKPISSADSPTRER